jgi:hypothetical protein
MNIARGLCVLIAVSMWTVAHGQGTITSGNASYTTAAGSDTGEADWLPNGPGITDELTTQQWLFRIGGSTGQTRLSMGTATSTTGGGAIGVTSQIYAGNVAVLDWASGGLAFHLVMRLTDGATDEAGSLLQSMRITNTNAIAASVDLFHYADLDVTRAISPGSYYFTSTSFSNDFAQVNGGNQMEVYDVNWPGWVTWTASNPSAYEMGAFDGLGSALRSATTYNLANNGTFFGTGNFTGAFQWTLQLAAGQAVTVDSNMELMSWPTPGTLSLLGLAGLTGARRRRG